MGTLRYSHDQPGGAPAGSDSAEIIPPIELSGSRLDKLRTLDEAIAQLLRRRRSLTGDDRPPLGGHEGPGRHVGSPEWPWLAAGTVLGALFVLLLLAARSCA